MTFRVDANGCHICTSHKIGFHGYPFLWKDGQNQHMHRVLYEEANGPLGNGLLARHTCDVRACINLAHVIPGTHQDNTDDATARGRHNPPIGERGAKKLTTAMMREIRKATGSQTAIARHYGIGQSHVSRIKSKQRWGSV